MIRAHIRAVQLQTLAIENPLVVFAQGTEGSESSTEYDGELGGEFFNHFKTILDYSRSRMILERNEHGGSLQDLSGLEIVAEPPRFRTFVVNAVVDNSPAAAAGVHEEDGIIAVNGRPTSRLTLKELRKFFTQPGEYLLLIKRGSKTIPITLRLQPAARLDK